MVLSRGGGAGSRQQQVPGVVVLCTGSEEMVMKAMRLVMLAALVASSMGSPLPAAPAAPPPTSNNQGANAELLQFCAELIQSGEFPALVLGECMSFNITSYQGFKAHLCDYIRSNDLWDEFGVTSYSDCVRNVDY